MLAIGAEELKEAPNLGETIICHMCGEEHLIEYGQRVFKDGSKVEDKTLAFFKCGEKTYLAGINGKDIRKRPESP